MSDRFLLDVVIFLIFVEEQIAIINNRVHIFVKHLFNPVHQTFLYTILLILNVDILWRVYWLKRKLTRLLLRMLMKLLSWFLRIISHYIASRLMCHWLLCLLDNTFRQLFHIKRCSLLNYILFLSFVSLDVPNIIAVIRLELSIRYRSFWLFWST